MQSKDQSIYMDSYANLKIDDLDQKHRKCPVHKRFLVWLDKRNGKEYCNHCETDKSEEIVSLEDYCYQQLQLWIALFNSAVALEAQIVKEKTPYDRALYNKLYALLTKDFGQIQPQNETPFSKDQVQELLDQAIEAFKEMDGSKLLALSSQLKEQQTLLAVRQAALGNKLSQDSLVKLSITNTDSYQEIINVVTDEENTSDVIEFLLKQIQSLSVAAAQKNQAIKEEATQLNQAQQDQIAEAKQEIETYKQKVQALEKVNETSQQKIATMESQIRELFNKIQSQESLIGIINQEIKEKLREQATHSTIKGEIEEQKYQSEEPKQIDPFRTQKQEKTAVVALPSEKLDSLILTDSEIIKNLENHLGNQKIKNLLYRGTRDGFGAKDWHRLCDNKGKTLTIVKSTNNNIFGGYTDLAFESNKVYKKGNGNTFLFLAQDDKTVLKFKYVDKEDREIVCYKNSGPCFGINSLVIYGNCHQNTNSFAYAGNTFEKVNNIQYLDGQGTINFQAIDLEVFQVE